MHGKSTNKIDLSDGEEEESVILSDVDSTDKANDVGGVRKERRKFDQKKIIGSENENENGSENENEKDGVVLGDESEDDSLQFLSPESDLDFDPPSKVIEFFFFFSFSLSSLFLFLLFFFLILKIFNRIPPSPFFFSKEPFPPFFSMPPIFLFCFNSLEFLFLTPTHRKPMPKHRPNARQHTPPPHPHKKRSGKDQLQIFWKT